MSLSILAFQFLSSFRSGKAETSGPVPSFPVVAVASDIQVFKMEQEKLEEQNHLTDEVRVTSSDDEADSSKCCSSCLEWCQPCLRASNPLPAEPSTCQRFRYGFLCPPHGPLAKGLTLILCLVLGWGVLWGLTGDEALPGGNLFSIFIVVVCASIGGRLVQFIRLPPLLGRPVSLHRLYILSSPYLGMLIVGFALRNIPVINVAKDISSKWSGALRYLFFF
jgi:hypothetical protein